MSETTTTDAPRVESPPATPIPARDSAPDPRAQLHKLATELVRARNRKVLVAYLRMRRAMR
jgi:hypothetical protein